MRVKITFKNGEEIEKEVPNPTLPNLVEYDFVTYKWVWNEEGTKAWRTEEVASVEEIKE